MTEPAKSVGLPQLGQALPNWDPLVRLAHWGIAGVVFANYALTKEGGSVHIALGWVGLGLLILRLIWGYIGPHEARFASFAPNPRAALRHMRGLLRGPIHGRALHYPSHNPAGAMMAYALWACLGVLTLTGRGMSGIGPFKQAELEAAVAAADWSAVVEEQGADESPFCAVLVEVHEIAANLILILAFLHVAGVFVEGRALRRNLVAPMLMSRKNRE